MFYDSVKVYNIKKQNFREVQLYVCRDNLIRLTTSFVDFWNNRITLFYIKIKFKLPREFTKETFDTELLGSLEIEYQNGKMFKFR